MRVAGISEELSELLGVQADVVCDELLHDRVSATAHAEAVALSAGPIASGCATS